MNDIEARIYHSQQGFLNIQTSDNLILFNYNQRCERAGAWNEFTLHSRGVIFDLSDGSCAAWPFPKFYDLRRSQVQNLNLVESISEKVDGHLGILYRRRDALRLATRGSFTSPSADVGTALLNEKYGLKFSDQISSNLTLLFEIVDPATRVIVDYGDQSSLTLLAVFDRFTRAEFSDMAVDEIANRYGFRRPMRYTPTIEFLNEQLRMNLPAEQQEGFVLRMRGGARVKVKTDAYWVRMMESIRERASRN